MVSLFLGSLNARAIDLITGHRVTSQQPQSLTKPSLAATKTKHLLEWYVVVDVMAMAMGLFAAWMLATFINGVFFDRTVMDLFSPQAMMRLAEFMIIEAAVLLWFQHTDHYQNCMPFWTEIRKIILALAVAAMADGFLQFILKNDISRSWLIFAWVIAALTMIGLRNLCRSILREKDCFKMHTLLVGGGDTAQYAREALTSDRCLNYEIVAQIKDLPSAFLRAGKSWEALRSMYDAEYIIIALDGNDLHTATQPLAQLAREGVAFSVVPPLHHLPVMGMVPHYFMNHDVMLLTRSDGLAQSFSCFLKRTLDIVVSAAALLALAPLMLFLMLWVKSDGGPAFYAHMRIGRHKKPFPCLKFRSMVMNGDDILARYLAENPAAREEWESSRKLLDDPRITRIGKFLRSTSLDELPQLINVLRGDMSLVGPRPIVTAEMPKYSSDIAHYCRVRPGVTGLWQVSGRSDVSYPRRVHMDSWYVSNWSLWHDIAILFKTLPALLNRTGAY